LALRESTRGFPYPTSLDGEQKYKIAKYYYNKDYPCVSGISGGAFAAFGIDEAWLDCKGLAGTMILAVDDLIGTVRRLAEPPLHQDSALLHRGVVGVCRHQDGIA
jgi:hypothetical protein